MNNKKPIGKVILAGAGPGDPDLVTYKTLKYLRIADVILVDRLVSSEILKLHASKKAEIIHVGKQCSLGLSTSQSTINELLVDYALAGKLIVRLKGGDVSIFSNILDELQILKEHHIPYEIIPGVTAALGAAAYTGIPLTARGYSTSVRFLTFYNSNILSEEYWKDLATTNDTLVFYMSSGTLKTVVKKLLNLNIEKEKLLAIVEEATTPFQKIHTLRFDDYENNLSNYKFKSPSIIIIGKVVALQNDFTWFKSIISNENYFDSVNSEVLDIKLTA